MNLQQRLITDTQLFEVKAHSQEDAEISAISLACQHDWASETLGADAEYDIVSVEEDI